MKFDFDYAAYGERATLDLDGFRINVLRTSTGWCGWLSTPAGASDAFGHKILGPFDTFDAARDAILNGAAEWLAAHAREVLCLIIDATAEKAKFELRMSHARS